MAEIAWDCKPELGSGLTLTLARGVPGASALLSSHYEQGPWMLWDKDPGWGGLGPNFATDQLCDLGQVTPLRVTDYEWVGTGQAQGTWPTRVTRGS